MGIGNLIESVAGAIAAEQAVEKVDPNAGILVQGAAAAAGFFGAGKLGEMLSSHPAPHAAPAAPAPAAAPASDDDIPPDPTLTPGDGTSV